MSENFPLNGKITRKTKWEDTHSNDLFYKAYTGMQEKC